MSRAVELDEATGPVDVASSVRGLKWPRRSFARSVGSSFDLGCRDSSEAFVLEHCSLASSPPGPPSFPGRRHPWAAPDYSRLLQDEAVEAHPPRLVADYTNAATLEWRGIQAEGARTRDKAVAVLARLDAGPRAWEVWYRNFLTRWTG